MRGIIYSKGRTGDGNGYRREMNEVVVIVVIIIISEEVMKMELSDKG